MQGFPFPIEAGHVLQFRRAIGETTSSEGAPPPTFAMAADHFDPAYRRRPGDPSRAVVEAAGALFHVEQRFEYHRHPRIGERLVAHRVEPRRWTKQGRRGGRLDFVELVTEVHDDAGQPVVTTTWLDVATEHSHASLSTQRSGPPPEPPAPAVAEDGELVGVVADPVTRTQIVMYVGAAGDFHPLHHDDVYARAHGYPGVFAPGMLTMALTGRSVAAAAGGVERLTHFGGRFTTQVWPGDTLTTRVRPAPADEATSPGSSELRATTSNQHGAVVFEGWAGART